MNHDEKIISLKMEQLEQQAPRSLEHGYYINGVLEKFVKTEIFVQRFWICLPESFVEMPEEVSCLKYPSSARPQIIRTNLECTVNFLFNRLDNPDGLTGKEAAESFGSILSRTNPAIRIRESGEETGDSGIELYSFDFTSFGMDDQIYHVMDFFVTGGCLIQMGFNCPLRLQGEWKPVAKEVFRTIEVGKTTL